MSKATDLARELAEEAVDTIAEVMRDPLAEQKDRLKAADMILDRAEGKPGQAVLVVQQRQQARLAASHYTDAELASFVEGEIVRRGLPAPESTDPLLE
jgi:hypothetical protein